MHRTLFVFFSLFFLSGSIQAQPTSAVEDGLKMFNAFMATARPETVRAELLVISPQRTATTAFGHVALRVSDPARPAEDYYVDFGNYDESVSFVRKFLSGNARFYTQAIPTEWSMESWARTGRGVASYELIMTPVEKKKFLQALTRTVQETQGGYEYLNFTRNCVTFIRGILEESYGRPIELKTLPTPTWRARVIPFSRTLFWLQLGENVWYNYITDQKRSPSEVIYLPFDLAQALEENNLVKKKSEILPDRWKVNLEKPDVSGWIVVILLCVIAISQLFPRFAGSGQVAFAIVSGFIGVVVWGVSLFTNFDFMTRNVLVFVFTPFDFLLASSRFCNLSFFKSNQTRIALVRVGLILLALAFALILPQRAYFPIAFALAFWALWFYRNRRSLNA